MKKTTYMIVMILLFIVLGFSEKVFAQCLTNLDIQSGAAVLWDVKAGQVLYGKNEEEKMYPASITKIATAIYAIEKGELGDLVTVSEAATQVEGTKVYLEPGEVVSLDKLIIGMLVNSGNDAAHAIAEHIDGSIEEYSKNINRFLKEKIGVSNTHFVNPHGLHDDNHYTTAKDMAKITAYALKNEQFAKYFQIQEYAWDGESWDTTLLTHHRLLKGEFPYEGITGGKNGYVDESGHTLVTSAKRDKRELIVVTLYTSFKNVPYTDTIQLLDYGFDQFIIEQIDQGTKFELGEQEFSTTKDLFYAVNKEDTITFKVSENGVLELVNDKGIVITSFKLKEKEGPKVKETFSLNKEEETKQVPILKNSLSIGFVLVVLVVLCFYYRYLQIKRRRKLRRQKQQEYSWLQERINQR